MFPVGRPRCTSRKSLSTTRSHARRGDLTAGAKTELEKIQAIGKFVQNLQYISIDIGVGYGNGMKPRPSDLVLGRGYGDCKDKANLMRAMLRALKIEAYPVVIYSGDPGIRQGGMGIAAAVQSLHNRGTRFRRNQGPDGPCSQGPRPADDL